MNPILVGVALVGVAGAVVAVSARDPRIVALALATILIFSPLLADPMMNPVALAARLIGSLLAVYLLWIAVRERPAVGPTATVTGGSRIGWPAEALVAAAAFVVGFSAHGLGATGGGPPLASAAGFAIAALAIPPMLTGRDVLRVGTGLFLLVDGALLVRIALGGTPAPLEELVAAGLLVALGGTLAALAVAARNDGPAGFDFPGDAQPRLPIDAQPRRR